MRKTVIRGVSWDHARGLKPLEAVAAAFAEDHPDVEIVWETRPLSAYEDQPIEELFGEFDMVAVNHPFIGDCAAHDLLLRLDDLLAPEFLHEQEQGSVGPSFASYQSHGGTYALAVDAASIVSAYSPGFLIDVDSAPPTSFSEVIALEKHLRRAGKPPLAVPLAPQHAYSAFLSLFANLAGQEGWGPEGLQEDAACEAVARLAELVDVVHPGCHQSNPIQLLEKMSKGEVSYIPYTYGYVNYVRATNGPHRVAFADMPGLNGTCDGGLLGGVGMGISSATPYRDLAAEFLTTVASPETQRHAYVDSQGQAGHRGAWTDSRVQADWPGFYDTTLKSLDAAFLRPRPAGFPKYQKRARTVVHRFLTQRDSAPREVVAHINADYRRTFYQGEN